MMASLGLIEVSCMGVLLRVWRLRKSSARPRRAVNGQAHYIEALLQLLDLDLAPFDGAAGITLGRAIAELERDWPLRELAVIQGGGLGPVQHDRQLRAFGRDLVDVPL